MGFATGYDSARERAGAILLIMRNGILFSFGSQLFQGQTSSSSSGLYSEVRSGTDDRPALARKLAGSRNRAADCVADAKRRGKWMHHTAARCAGAALEMVRNQLIPVTSENEWKRYDADAIYSMCVVCVCVSLLKSQARSCFSLFSHTKRVQGVALRLWRRR